MTNRRFRSSRTGRFADADEAEAAPDTHVSEALPEPVDLEAAAQRLYAALVADGAEWDNLPQHLRDSYRSAAKGVLEEAL